MKYIILLLIFSNLLFADSDDIKANLEKLTSTEFGGRLPGTTGIDKAAQFIKEQFQEAGLKPINDSWFQEFSVKSGKKLSGENNLSFNIFIPRPGIPKEKLRPRTATWNNMVDWTPLQFSSNGSYNGEMIFVGYGISSESLAYDDYSNIDVAGKAVVILTDSPNGKSKTGKFARYSSMRYKISNAKEHNAAAVIFIKSQDDSANVLEKLDVNNRMSTNSGILAAQVSREKFIKYFPKNAGLLKLENSINETKKPASVTIDNKEISIIINIEDIKYPTKNIIGVLEGKNPNKYIFMGAHYDHLGVSNSGSSRYRDNPPKIHPGADDNASGVASMIEIANRLKNNKPEHSVIFAAWSAEEMGLLGSDNYVNNNFDLKENVLCYLNFDMVGRLTNSKLSILGTGTAEEFNDLINKTAEDYNFEISMIQTGMGPSDHSSFYKAKKPVLAIFSGIHSDYHTPEDTPDKINWEGMDSIINFSIDLFESIDKKGNLTFQEVQINEKSKTIRRGGSSVVMGVIPNYSDIDHGFIIDGVTPKGPAALAGLKGGDILIEVDGDKIVDIYDFMYSYWDKNPGDIVVVKVLRDNKDEPISLKVKLAAKE
ncbi:M20/M25/M40 family metallo-hydrolase [Candidatus Kapabacteria bacterium]|nr:M20/M25/M40 family metallo-hydrolase [Candidatus Kapabacteria bacterium]